MVATTALGAPSAVAAPPAPRIYWVDEGLGRLGEASLDGSGADSTFITGASAPVGLAVDGQHVYWANASSGSIGRADLDGTAVNQAFITGADGPWGVAVNGRHIYWTNEDGGSIGRANLDGTGVNQSLITGVGEVTAVAVDGRHVYWTDALTGDIGRANLDGTDVDRSFITGQAEPTGVAVDGSHIYWTGIGANEIGRANLDGSGVDQDFITASDLVAVAVDGHHIYWTGVNGTGFAIGRANLDGSGQNDSFIPLQVAIHAGVAVSVPVAQVTPAAPPAFAATSLGALSAPQTLTISNSGQQDLSVAGVSFGGQDPGDFVVDSNGCTGAVAPGASCQLTVRFSPGALGSRTATLDIATSDFANSPLQVPLSGTGVIQPPPPPNTTTTGGNPPPLTTAPGSGPGATAAVPALSGLRVSPKTVRVSGRKTNGRCVAQTKQNKTRPACTRNAKLTFAFTLSAAAPVKFKLTGKLPGQKAGKRCVAQTEHNARAKRCLRSVTVKGMAARQGKLGANRFTLSRRLAPGTYTLTATPVGGVARTATYKVTG